MYHLPLNAFLLLVFLAFLPGVHGQEESEVESLRQRLTEARELHVQFQEEKLQLEREKASLERELASLRKQYATLLLENDKNAQSQTELDLAAIHLIKGAENGELGEGDAARMVELLGHCLARLREVEKIGAALEDTIVAALDASGSSQALREPVEKSLAAFRESLEAALSEIGLASTPDAEASSGSGPHNRPRKNVPIEARGGEPHSGGMISAVGWSECATHGGHPAKAGWFPYSASLCNKAP